MTTDWKPTACILCECNCGIVVQLDGRNLAKIRGDKDHPASQGYTCNKALRLDHYQNNSNRLTSPMRRTPDGSYEEIDWDTAITEVAERFKHIRDTHGGDKIFYTTGRLTSEMVIKAAQMRIPFLVSRSGLTKMGHDIAQKIGITMIGRAAGGKHYLLFTGRHRFRKTVAPTLVA